MRGRTGCMTRSKLPQMFAIPAPPLAFARFRIELIIKKTSSRLGVIEITAFEQLVQKFAAFSYLPLYLLKANGCWDFGFRQRSVAHVFHLCISCELCFECVSHNAD
jgi:hypothetical protein